MTKHLLIENPKQKNNYKFGKPAWYPFYAGFSANFAFSLLKSSGLKKDSCILDPWNGTGTTTSSAAKLGYSAIGFDLNPVMVVIAKARLLSKREKSSLLPLASEILKKALRNKDESSEFDPLCMWFTPACATTIRNIEKSIQKMLVDEQVYAPPNDQAHLKNLSSLAAFFYTALFRATRALMTSFVSSNPTWIKRPKTKAERLSPSTETIQDAFKYEMKLQIDALEEDLLDWLDSCESSDVFMASSNSIPIENHSVDFILTSPPYCTRIDYAVATMPELAVLGVGSNEDFESLRRSLIGNVTVPKLVPTPSSSWGNACNFFIEQLSSHESKASQSYYYKNHVQYFDSIFRSVQEVVKKLRRQGILVVVIQDSYYKEIHNDLPLIFSEMAESCGLQISSRNDFVQNQTMASVNSKSKRYRKNFKVTESVLCFVKS